MRAGGPDSPNSPAGASGPGSWGTGGRCSPSPSAGASPPREQGQGQITAGGTEGAPQGDPRMANNRGGEVNFPKDGRGSSRAGQAIAHPGERGGQPREGRAGPPAAQAPRSPQEGAGGSPTAGGVGGLTKASLAVLKACSSCGDRDLNSAMWQPLAGGTALGAEGTGAAPVLLSATVSSISTSTSVQPGAVSASGRIER